MSHIDTLQTYENLINAGFSEEEAKEQVKVLDKSLDSVVTKEYLTQEFTVLRSEIKSDLAFTVMLPIFIAYIVQIYFKKKGWL